MPNLPAVSVVMPYHDEGELVNRALESVRTQAYDGPLEIIVVDDASRVPATEVVDPKWNARIIRNSANRHAAGSRNVGIQQATGEYICFLDSDDVYLPNRITPHIAFLEEHPEISLAGSGVVIHRNGQVWEHVPKLIKHLYPNCIPDRPVVLPAVAAIDVFLYFPFHTGALTVRAQVLRRCQFEETWPWGEEWDLQLRLLQTENAAFLPGFVYQYIERAGSLCRTSNPDKYVSAARLFRKWRLSRRLPAAHVWALRRLEHKRLLLAAQIYQEEGRPAAAWGCACSAAMRWISGWGIRSIVRTSFWLPACVGALGRQPRARPSERCSPVSASAAPPLEKSRAS